MSKRTGIPFHFHQLDNITREIMKEELEMDLNSNGAYQSPRLTSDGLHQFPKLLKRAIDSGTDISFSEDLRPFFNKTEISRSKKGEKYVISLARRKKIDELYHTLLFKKSELDSFLEVLKVL